MTRRWMIVIVAVCLVVAAVAVAYAAVQNKASGPDVVRAQRFELVDAEGRVRALLAMSLDGRPGLAFLDEKGEGRAGLVLGTDGPTLELWDKKGKLRARLAVHPDLGPALTLHDEQGVMRAGLLAGTDGRPGLAFLDEKGKPLTLLGVGVDAGGKGLVLLDEKGETIWRAP